ncbi:hypothetical protein [Algoriphagus aquimarinus]|uniref:Uncharacterized protein n=1 Tax=Algoriphagus aquimarinus TaxID=237018 RepID=A0A1I1BHI0_9BACT|nr:hypothetical protein [Algoriphagus aquimarinus]SFB49192.1 hypothetical protein SAMN04489723_11391 [Algoriphagus aquimarinus]|tara:strand:+ start:195342 stop:195623 length:282 start_codon:yes stop_codon:yes gene_type:complete
MEGKKWKQIRIELQLLNVDNLINTGLTYLTFYYLNNHRTERGSFADWRNVVGIVKHKTLKRQTLINYLVLKGDKLADQERVLPVDRILKSLFS